MSSSVLGQVTSRRHLSTKQSETVQRLLAATVEELGTADFDALTVRRVATRAGVAAATAYTYFGSKDHLVAAEYWRRVQTLPELNAMADLALGERVGAALGAVSLLVADEPGFASACTTALMSREPAVAELRILIGTAVLKRIAQAVGAPETDDRVVALNLAYSGALLQAGMGHLSYGAIIDRIVAVARLLEPLSKNPGSPLAPGFPTPHESSGETS